MKRHALTYVIASLTAATTAGLASAGTAAPCKTSDLVVWVDTTGNATAGSVFVALKFTDMAGHACALSGYPGISAVDLRGHALTSPGSRLPSTPRVVRSATGATASATLQIAPAGNFPPSACRRRAAAALRVYLPNKTASKLVPIPFEASSHPGLVFLGVKAVTP